MNDKREDKALKRAIRELPLLSPEESSWDHIEQSLSEDPGAFKQPVKFRRVYLAAASVAIFLTACFMLINRDMTDTGITYSVETQTTVFLAEQDFAGVSNQFESFLNVECANREEICDDEDFNLLVKQLEHVKTEKDALMEMIRTAGNSLRLEKAWLLLEKEDARLKKEIVKLLMS